LPGKLKETRLVPDLEGSPESQILEYGMDYSVISRALKNLGTRHFSPARPIEGFVPSGNR
jgi:hypothetical protein